MRSPLARGMAAAIALLVVLVLPALASAAEAVITVPAGTVLPLAPAVAWLMPYLQAIVMSLIPPVTGWLIYELRARRILSLSKANEDTLGRVLMNAASLVLARGGASISGMNVHVNSQTVNALVPYVQEFAAAAAKHLTPGQIAEKIVSKIPQVPLAASAGAQSDKAPLSNVT